MALWSYYCIARMSTLTRPVSSNIVRGRCVRTPILNDKDCQIFYRWSPISTDFPGSSTIYNWPPRNKTSVLKVSLNTFLIFTFNKYCTHYFYVLCYNLCLWKTDFIDMLLILIRLFFYRTLKFSKDILKVGIRNSLNDRHNLEIALNCYFILNIF